MVKNGPHMPSTIIVYFFHNCFSNVENFEVKTYINRINSMVMCLAFFAFKALISGRQKTVPSLYTKTKVLDIPFLISQLSLYFYFTVSNAGASFSYFLGWELASILLPLMPAAVAGREARSIQMRLRWWANAVRARQLRAPTAPSLWGALTEKWQDQSAHRRGRGLWTFPRSISDIVLSYNLQHVPGKIL